MEKDAILHLLSERMTFLLSLPPFPPPTHHPLAFFSHHLPHPPQIGILSDRGKPEEHLHPAPQSSSCICARGHGGLAPCSVGAELLGSAARAA